MTDERIVALFFDRSEEAIKETSRLYGRYFHYVAYGILRDEGDTQEIINDAYLKTWNEIPPARPRNLKAFIGVLVRRLSIDRLRTRTAKKRGGGQMPLALDELNECVSGEVSETDAGALREALNDFLRSLPEEARRIFIRRYWHLHSIERIARELCASESKIKSSLMRTRTKLKNYLAREGFSV